MVGGKRKRKPGRPAAARLAVGLTIAVLALTAAIAVAASPPIVTTGPATGVTQSSATLTGTVNPNQQTITSCRFSWGVAGGPLSSTPCDQTVGSGATNVTATITGLLPNTTYTFDLAVTDSTGTQTAGIGQSFTTLDNPTAVTSSASAVSPTAATLNGTVNPNGVPVTSCQFEWGTTTAYGHSSPCLQTPGSGTSPVPVSTALTGLAPNTTYHFQLVATNASGPGVGSDKTFTTGSGGAIAVTTAASGVSPSGATLNGEVNPNGSSVTSCSFEWGTTTSYGSTAPCTQTVGSGSSAVAVATNVTGLAPNTTYHFQLIVKSSDQTAAGGDQVLTTTPLPPPVLGKSVDVAPVSGVVLIKLPGHGAGDVLPDASAPPQLQGFATLTGAQQVPTGSVVDAQLGQMQLVSATGSGHGTQAGTFGGGIFKLSQSPKGAMSGLTTLSVVEGTIKGAPSYARCPRVKSGHPLSTRVLQRLKAQAHGRFSTRTKYSAANATNASWTTVDRCDGTLTVVKHGTVRLNDLRRHRTVTVHAGHSYLANAPLGK